MGSGSSKYRLGERIGGGGMAEVFRATKVGVEGFARTVAIKRILPTLSADASFADMFKREARLAALLAHPNIVAVDDFDLDDEGRLFLVMELVDGKDLRELQESGRLPSSVSAFLIAQVLRGLAYAHELTQQGRPLGMVHRDVSPHNVLVSWDGAVKLSDFGIAKAMGATDASRSGTLKGKVSYMSPEQAHASDIDGRADVWAVGVMFHELLAGERLFAGATEAEVLSRMLAQPIASPRELNPEVTEDVAAVCMGMLERDRDRRFASARAALEALLNSDVVSARSQQDLTSLMAARFPQHAPARGGGVPAIGGGVGPTAPLQARDRAIVAAMEAPTRTEAPGHNTGTPTAAGEARPGIEVTATAPARARSRRSPLAVALAVVAAAGLGALAVAFVMGAFGGGGDGAGSASAGVAVAPRDEDPPPLALLADGGAVVVAVSADAAPVAIAPPDGSPAELPAAGDTSSAVDGERVASKKKRRRDKNKRDRNADKRDVADSSSDAASGGDTPTLPRPDPVEKKPPVVERAPKGEGVLHVRVQPWATVTVKGHGTKTTPATWTLPAGTYKVTLVNEERNKTNTVTVTVEPGKPLTISRNWTK